MAVINFDQKAREKLACVWSCDCGCCSMLLYEDGQVQCTKCDAFQVGTGGVIPAVWTKKVEKK